MSRREEDRRVEDRWRLPEPSTSASQRFEPALVAFFFVCWAAAAINFARPELLPDGPRLSFYALYSISAALGWLAGNVYVHRRRQASRRARRALLRIYGLLPPGAALFLASIGEPPILGRAPFVPVYALGVYAVFFSVPVLLKRPRPRR